MEKKNIDYEIEDMIMGRPHGFSVEGERFFLYPLSLGKLYLLQRLYEQLEINTQYLQLDISYEAIRLAKLKRSACIQIIAYSSCKDKEEVFDTTNNRLKIQFLDKNLSEEDIVTLMIIILSSDKTSLALKHLGIEKEQERIKQINRIKNANDKNTITTGGISVYGTLIDAACERYGWTKDYVVWGIDYASLRLMLADKINTIYITDEERKKMPASLMVGDGDTLKATKENMEAIKKMDWR